MPKKKPHVPHRIVTGHMAEEVARDDYGCVAIGGVIDGIAFAESASIPASDRRAEIAAELDHTAGEGHE